MATIFTIGDRLRRARRAKDLVQSQVASALGVSQATISDCDCGRRIAMLRTYVGYAELVGVDVDELLAEMRTAIGALDRVFIDYDLVMQQRHMKNGTATMTACEVRQTA